MTSSLSSVEATAAMEEKPELIGVKVVSVISPAKVTVVYQQPSLASLRALELDITKSWEGSFCTDVQPPQSSAYIAVREEPGGRCKRGFVTSVAGNQAEVFLCDYGTFIIIDSEDADRWTPLSDLHRIELAFQAFIAVIPGLTPARSMKLPTGEKLIPAHTWSEASIAAANAWFDMADQVAITIFKKESPILTYADFYKMGSPYPLSYAMELQRLAIVDSEKFTKLVL